MTIAIPAPYIQRTGSPCALRDVGRAITGHPIEGTEGLSRPVWGASPTTTVLYTGAVPAPRYQPYLDTASSGFRWRLGLRPLDLDNWLEIDEHADTELAQKLEVLADFPGTAVRMLDDVEAEGMEIYETIARHLVERYGRSVPPLSTDLHPLDAAGRLIQEDLVVLVERDGRLVCGGGSVCFPNRWDLASKVGQTMEEIHEPVALLNEQLAHPIDDVLSRLRPERSFWRLGYGLLDSPELYQAVDGTARSGVQATTPHEFVLRVERETLRRLPVTNCVLFTIRTHISPLPEVPVGVESVALAAALESMPAEVLDYKRLTDVSTTIVDWLRAR